MRIYTMPESFLSDSEVPARWRVLGLINGFFINGRKFYGSNAWIAEKLKCSENTATNAIQELEELGLVSCERTSRTRLVSRVLMTPTEQEIDPNQFGSKEPLDPNQLVPNSVSSNSVSKPMQNKILQKVSVVKKRSSFRVYDENKQYDELPAIDADSGDFVDEPPERTAKFPNAKEIFSLFPVRSDFWKVNTSIRGAAQRLFEQKGFDVVKRAMEFYNENKDEPFCPQIHSPKDLEEKWEKLKEFKNKK